MLQHGWVLQTLRWVRETRYKRSYITWLHPHPMFRTGKSVGTKTKLQATGDWGQGEYRVTTVRYRVSLGVARNVLQLNSLGLFKKKLDIQKKILLLIQSHIFVWCVVAEPKLWNKCLFLPWLKMVTNIAYSISFYCFILCHSIVNLSGNLNK